MRQSSKAEYTLEINTELRFEVEQGAFVLLEVRRWQGVCAVTTSTLYMCVVGVRNFKIVRQCHLLHVPLWRSGPAS